MFDRFAVAFLSAVLAFVSGTVIWGLLAGIDLGGAFFTWVPFTWVLWFTLLMATLGFLLLENYLVVIFEKLWRAIGYFFVSMSAASFNTPAKVATHQKFALYTMANVFNDQGSSKQFIG